MIKKLLLTLSLVSLLLASQSIDLDINGSSYTVKLEENKRLNAFSKGGAFFYTGKLEADSESWVRVSFKEGAWRGSAYVFSELYEINQISQIKNFQAASNGFFKPAAKIIDKMKSKKMDLSALEGEFCGMQGHAASTQQSQIQSIIGIEPQVAFAAAAVSSDRVLDLEIALDHFFVQSKGSEEAAIESALNIINSLDGVYTKEFGISVNLVNLEVYATDEDDPFTNSSSHEDLLNDVRAKGNTQSAFHQNTTSLEHLITGRNIDGNVLGVAYLGTNCGSSYSYAFSQNYGGSTFLVMAHEIGHSLGSEHDGSGASASCSSGYLMYPSINGSDTFSSCSKDSMLNNGGGLNSSCVKEAVDISIEQIGMSLSSLEEDRIVDEIYSIKNLSSKTSNNFILSGELSSGSIELISASVDGSGCSINTQGYECNLAEIGALSSKTLSLRYQAKTSTQEVRLSHVLKQPYSSYADTQLLNNSLSNSYKVETILSPSTLTANAEVNDIILRWTDNSFVETQYEVERSINASAWSVISTLQANSSSYRDEDIDLNQSYYYRVRAKKSTQVSNYSNVVDGIANKMQKPQNFRMTRIR